MSAAQKLALKILTIAMSLSIALGVDIIGWGYCVEHCTQIVAAAVMVPVTAFLIVVGVVVILMATGDLK